MRPEPTDTTDVAAQRAWAERRGLHVDPWNYLLDLESNLRAPLSPAARLVYETSSGSELSDQVGRPAKMRALHSSSALTVNVFDF